MPKMKTHKGAAKRTKVKPSGKIEITAKGRGHNTGWKKSKISRQKRGKQYMTNADKSRIKTMLGL